MSEVQLQIGEAASRLATTKAWDSDISRLRFVTGARREALCRIGLYTIRDLLLHVPFRYLDFTNLSSIAYAEIGQEATIVGTVDKVALKVPRPKMQLVEVYLLDQTGVLRCTFFKQPWLEKQLKKGDVLAVSGKVEFRYNYKQMVPQFHEVIAKADDDSNSTDAKSRYMRVLPVHSLTEGITAGWMRRIASAALADFGDAADFLPAALVAKNHLMTEARALREAHYPSALASAEFARRRLAFDELISLQIALLCRQAIALENTRPHTHVTNGPHMQALLAAMPFELTGEQKQAAREVLLDMQAPRPMNRLLLGDVGTGKTAVAAVVLAACADSGSQGAVMAPTSVLAQQYAEKLGPLFDSAGISWTLVTGSTPQAERTEIAQKVSEGAISVVFGTSALLSEDIEFKDLSLVVVDEQHRFGVNQRSALRTKGNAPDQLVMTATPIPRTLALSVYGDLTSSEIRNRPHATAGVTTKILTPENVDIAHTAIAEALAAGHQAYVVCPLVDDKDEGSELEDDVADSEHTNAPLHSAQHTFETMKRRIFKDARVGLITGRMSAQDKDNIMAAFRAGEIDILVSTTVIEVGIDVPNATVMLIWNADRFGLATLHQLRGRVGRGKLAGTVYLVSAARNKSMAARRLKVLEKTSNGFELAQMDLQLRHEGEVLGYKQSGGVTLHLVDLSQDMDLIEAAHADAQTIFESDPVLLAPEHVPLAYEVRRRFGAFFTGERNR